MGLSKDALKPSPWLYDYTRNQNRKMTSHRRFWTSHLGERDESGTSHLV